MTPAEYRAFVASMLTYPGALSWESCITGAIAEAGEALGYVRKALYQGHVFEREEMALELGDTLFFAVALDEVSDRRAIDADLWLRAFPMSEPGIGLDGALWLSRQIVRSYGMAGDFATLALTDALRELRQLAGFCGYSLADLAALNVAKLRARYAASGGQFDAAVSAGRVAE